MIKLVGMKMALNIATSIGFAITGKWSFAILFLGCALADLGSIFVILQR
jgi:hypothetical protein